MKRSHAVPENYNPTCTKVPWNGKRSSLKHSSNSNISTRSGSEIHVGVKQKYDVVEIMSENNFN